MSGGRCGLVKPTIEMTRDGENVMVLCPSRHMVRAIRASVWDGSDVQIAARDPEWKVYCGAVRPVATEEMGR